MLRKTPSFLKKVLSHILWEGDNSLPQVALTFDDGPHPEWTPRILDILESFRAHASFFVVGKLAKQHPDIVRRIASEGHTVGNHTMSHSVTILRNHAFYQDEIKKNQELLKNITGTVPRDFRPPRGLFDIRCFREVASLDMRIVMWSYAPEDWKKTTSAKITRRIHTHMRQGSIILLHDGLPERSGATVDALPRILKEGTTRGLIFVGTSNMSLPQKKG